MVLFIFLVYLLTVIKEINFMIKLVLNHDMVLLDGSAIHPGFSVNAMALGHG